MELGRPRQVLWIPHALLVIAVCLLLATQAEGAESQTTDVQDVGGQDSFEVTKRLIDLSGQRFRELLDGVAAANWRSGTWDQPRYYLHNCLSRRHTMHRQLAKESGSKANTALVAIFTANVWSRTEALLISLASISDDVDVVVFDELSTDDTPKNLQNYRINLFSPDEPRGLTYDWNMAYRYFITEGYKYFFIINNDVLVPDGVFDKLVNAMDSGCDVVVPLSTNRGKAAWGRSEGVESVYGLGGSAAHFVNNPLNYHRVQQLLDEATGEMDPQRLLYRGGDLDPSTPGGFSGFFFGMRSSIARAEHSPGNLFNPANRIVGQEGDLTSRINAAGMKTCVHAGAFVFHYKGSTIPPELGDGREQFVRPGL